MSLASEARLRTPGSAAARWRTHLQVRRVVQRVRKVTRRQRGAQALRARRRASEMSALRLVPARLGCARTVAMGLGTRRAAAQRAGATAGSCSGRLAR